jgi:hypothetical protein
LPLIVNLNSPGALFFIYEYAGFLEIGMDNTSTSGKKKEYFIV